eukprot:COSAG04_NODE_3085_length_3185_cov_2.242385_2_plen_203_part_00
MLHSIKTLNVTRRHLRRRRPPPPPSPPRPRLAPPPHPSLALSLPPPLRHHRSHRQSQTSAGSAVRRHLSRRPSRHLTVSRRWSPSSRPRLSCSYVASPPRHLSPCAAVHDQSLHRPSRRAASASAAAAPRRPSPIAPSHQSPNLGPVSRRQSLTGVYRRLRSRSCGHHHRHACRWLGLLEEEKQFSCSVGNVSTNDDKPTSA